MNLGKISTYHHSSHCNFIIYDFEFFFRQSESNCGAELKMADTQLLNSGEMESYDHKSQEHINTK